MVLAVAAKIIPILLLIALGVVLRAKSFVAEGTVRDLKSLVVNVALPSVFFPSFLRLRLDASLPALAALIIAVCTVQLFYGKGVKALLRIDEPYFPYLATGFEFGMVGITLFGSAYGIERLGAIGVIGLGHEFFVWFVLVTLLVARRDGRTNMGQTLKTFTASPVILSIIAGIACNLLGLEGFISGSVLTSALLSTMALLAGLTIPLILIIIGYGIRFSRGKLKRSSVVAAARLALLIPAALLLNVFFIRRLLGLGPLYERALFTFLILPPPYVIPLYIGEKNGEDRAYANNTLMLHTVATILIFVIFLIATAKVAV